MSVEANNKQEAIAKMKKTMDEKAIASHMAEMHPGEEVPPVAKMHAMIEQQMAPAAA